MTTAANPTANPAAANVVYANPVTEIHPAEVAPEVAAAMEWVAALRDTEVAQGHSFLMQDTGYGEAYCCLGIACEVSGIGAWGWVTDASVADASPGVYVYLVGADTSRRAADTEKNDLSCLPEPVRARLGLRTNLGEFRVTSEWLAALETANPPVARLMRAYLAGACGALFNDARQLLAEVSVTLAGLNDDGDMAFDDIAAIIDSRPPGLFTW